MPRNSPLRRGPVPRVPCASRRRRPFTTVSSTPGKAAVAKQKHQRNRIGQPSTVRHGQASTKSQSAQTMEHTPKQPDSSRRAGRKGGSFHRHVRKRSTNLRPPQTQPSASQTHFNSSALLRLRSALLDSVPPGVAALSFPNLPRPVSPLSENRVSLLSAGPDEPARRSWQVVSGAVTSPSAACRPYSTRPGGFVPTCVLPAAAPTAASRPSGLQRTAPSACHPAWGPT